MRIVFVHDNFVNEQHGIYNHTSNLHSHLLKNSDVSYLGTITPSSKKDKIIYNLIPRTLVQTYQLLLDIRRHNPDIVHIHGTHLPFCLLPILLKKKYITVVTIHGIVALDSNESIRNRILLKKYFFSFFEKLAVKNATALIAVSPAIEKLVSEIYSPRCIIKVIPNGVNLKDFQFEQKIELLHPAILFIGRLVKTKNVSLLIQAIAELRCKYPNIHVYIAGTGPQYNTLCKKVKKENLENNVTFLGYIYGNDKLKYYHSVDFCVVPSNFESFSIVVLESMAASKPVIGSNVGGIPYLIEDGINGFLFSAKDVSDLSLKISLLLEDKSLRFKMGQAGNYKSKSFDWDIVATKTLIFYKSLFGCEHQ